MSTNPDLKSFHLFCLDLIHDNNSLIHHWEKSFNYFSRRSNREIPYERYDWYAEGTEIVVLYEAMRWDMIPFFIMALLPEWQGHGVL